MMSATMNYQFRAQDALPLCFSQQPVDQVTSLLTNSIMGYGSLAQSQCRQDQYPVELLGKRSNSYELESVLQKRVKTDLHNLNALVNCNDPQMQLAQELYTPQLNFSNYALQNTVKLNQQFFQPQQSMEGLIGQNLNANLLQKNLLMATKSNPLQAEASRMSNAFALQYENQNLANLRKAANEMALIQAAQQQALAFQQSYPQVQTSAFQVNPQNAFIQQNYYQDPQSFGIVSTPLIMNQSAPNSYMVMNGNQLVQVPGGNFAILNIDRMTPANNYVQTQPQQLYQKQSLNYLANQNSMEQPLKIPVFDYENNGKFSAHSFELSNSTKASEDEKSEEGDFSAQNIVEEISSDSASEENELGKKVAEKKKKVRKTHLNIEVGFSPENLAMKSKERRRNRWQEVQEEQEKNKIFDKIKYINETTFNHDEQKITETPVGEAHQAIVPELTMKSTRKPKQVWNPESISEEKLISLNDTIREKLEIEANHEKLTKLLVDNGHSVENLLELIENDKKKFHKLFKVKIIKPKNEAIQGF